MNISIATIKDIKQIFNIEKESFKDFRSEEQIENDITSNPFGIFLVAKIDEEVVGYYNFFITFDSATIYRIATLKSKKRQGIARNLLQKGYKIMRDKDVEFLTLEVRVSNIEAIGLYKSEGFDLITTKKSYYDDGEDAYYMMKGLI